MPRLLKKQELARRIKRGRNVRFMMEEKGIGLPDLRKKFKRSRSSLWFALRRGKMPALLTAIEKYVENSPVKIQ